LAGPKVLEHAVDFVLYFEGDVHTSFRIIRSVKNRFGSTHEVGIFEMGSEGLTPVANPSQFSPFPAPCGQFRFSGSSVHGGDTPPLS